MPTAAIRWGHSCGESLGLLDSALAATQISEALAGPVAGDHDTTAADAEVLDADPDAGPVHVMRFGTHHDIADIIAPSADADRAVRYLAKYLTKAIGDPLGDNGESVSIGRECMSCATPSNPSGPGLGARWAA
jgi:hypothetical protein